jgi:phage terminase small subunit
MGKNPKKTRPPKAPAHLQLATRKWWNQVVGTYELEEHHLKLLALACKAWERSEQAREVLDREGLTYLDGEKPKPRPEIAVERDSRIAFARLLRELALDVEPPADVRPPRLLGTAGR